MSLLLRAHYQLAKESLKRNSGRTFLTCLGIAIGVASIILILSLTGSINRLISAQIKAAGDNLIIVRPSASKSTVDDLVSELTSSNQFVKSSLNLTDVTTIKQLPAVTGVAPIAISINTLQGSKTVDSGSVVGTAEDLADILNLGLKTGSFHLGAAGSTPGAVIGRNMSLQLFGTPDSVGETFTLLGTKFIITGTLSELNDPINFNNVNLDDSVLVSAETLHSIENNLQIQQINVRVKTEDEVPVTAIAIENGLKNTKSGETNFTVSYGDQISHPASSFFSVISGMLTLVAGISLIVGGIGVMNIMLVAVAERTHEIGIRKAIGATNTNVFLQFLFESLILSILGGFGGLILGYVMAFLVSVFTPFPPYIDLHIVLSALYIPLIVGVIFGLYPAAKAAHKNPIDSLKFFR